MASISSDHFILGILNALYFSIFIIEHLLEDVDLIHHFVSSGRHILRSDGSASIPPVF